MVNTPGTRQGASNLFVHRSSNQEAFQLKYGSSPASSGDPFANLVKKALNSISKCFIISRDEGFTDTHFRQRTGFDEIVNGIPRGTSVQDLEKAVRFALRNMHALVANGIVQTEKVDGAIDDDVVDDDLVVDWTRLITNARLGYVITEGNCVTVPNFRSICFCFGPNQPEFAYVLYLACQEKHPNDTPDLDLSNRDDEVSISLTVVLIRGKGDEELSLNWNYSSVTEVNFDVIADRVERGPGYLPEDITYEMVSDFVRYSLRDQPSTFVYDRRDWIQASVNMHIVDDASDSDSESEDELFY